MAIDYFSLLGDDGWTPLSVDTADPQQFWSDGRPIAEAPVDLVARFGTAVGHSAKLDPAFNLRGVRCPAGFTIPMRHLNHDQLTIVVGGSVDVEFLDRGQGGDAGDVNDGGGGGDDGGGGDGDDAPPPADTRTVGAGQFFVVDAATPFMVSAGPEGATFIESWREPVATLETYWHDRGW